VAHNFFVISSKRFATHLQKQKGHEDQTSCPFVPFVVNLLTLVCRVSPHPTISHGFPAAQLAVVPALSQSAALPDALPAVVARAADAPALVEAAACTYYVLAAVAERACKFAAADCAAVLSVLAACLHCSNAVPVQASADGRHVSD
jgi:hypothetical protein